LVRVLLIIREPTKPPVLSIADTKHYSIANSLPISSNLPQQDLAKLIASKLVGSGLHDKCQ